MSRKRKTNGQCFVELIVGGIVMVPVMLFGLDVITLGLSCSINDHLAKEAARSAANQLNGGSAKTAASNVVARLKKSSILTKAEIVDFKYSDRDKVSVKTSLYVKVPAPFPYFQGANIFASAVEPIVGNPVAYQEQTD